MQENYVKKNKNSHRALALKKVTNYLQNSKNIFRGFKIFDYI